jgi:hypothetical protein
MVNLTLAVVAVVCWESLSTDGSPSWPVGEMCLNIALKKLTIQACLESNALGAFRADLFRADQTYT